MPTITQTCRNGHKFEIAEEDQKFYDRFKAPLPDLCFLCSQRQRLNFRNGRKLYRRKCDLTGENIISIYASDKPYKVFKSEHWYGDKWDAIEYGRDFDFNRPFFDQLKELQVEVPRLALMNFKGENSEFCNVAFGNKNCYCIFGGDFNEDCYYGTLCMHNKDCVDLDYGNENNLMYMSSDCSNCYNSRFVYDCKNCSDSAYITECSGCKECILCCNQVQKSYCISNKQYTKEKYLEKKKEFLKNSPEQQKKIVAEFLKLRTNRIVKYIHTVHCENCSGDYMLNSKNCQMCFDGADSEDLKDIIFSEKAKDCRNASLIGEGSELILNCLSTVKTFNASFSNFVLNSSDIEYCDMAVASQNLFGCVGLRHKKYCILNKQYTKEDYGKLRGQIIEYMKRTGELGHFLPTELSCFAYNESTAHEYFPLEKEEALKRGFKWRDQIDLPEDDNKVTGDALICEKCRKKYRLVSPEVDFYKNMDLPFPVLCYDCRYDFRKSIRNPRWLWKRECQNCGKSLYSTYAPERPEKVYCEECYTKAIF